eukprot:127715-Prymnesium_polylepis.1
MASGRSSCCVSRGCSHARRAPVPNSNTAAHTGARLPLNAPCRPRGERPGLTKLRSGRRTEGPAGGRRRYTSDF